MPFLSLNKFQQQQKIINKFFFLIRYSENKRKTSNVYLDHWNASALKGNFNQILNAILIKLTITLFSAQQVNKSLVHLNSI